jgi:hypothetical protein
MAQPEHLAVSGARVVVEAQQMECAVRGKKSDLRRQRPTPPLGLPCGLRSADHDVAELERAVSLPFQRGSGGLSLRASAQRLSEGEDVGRAVLPAIAAIELAHRRIVDECDHELRIFRDPVGPERGANAAARGREVTRSLASDPDLQRSDAALSDACGIRAIRSSGYGMRSWYTPRRSSQNASLIRWMSRSVRSHSSS